MSGGNGGHPPAMAVLGSRYRLVERLGSGGMSVVWRAFDEVLGRQVAVKVLAGDYAANPDFRRAIRHEARAAAHVTHPNIGVVYDYGEWRDLHGVVVPYVVMELIDGPSLRDRLRRGTLPWRSAVGVCAQVAAALSAAHALGLVHRDVKPGNVLLPTAGAKVVDFGISALVGEQVDADSVGTVLGTAGYVAPERLLGAPVGAAADTYSLGIVLFKTLVGRLPWQVDGDAQLLAAHLGTAPDALPPIEGLPAEVGEVYLRCVAKDPRERPAVAEVASALGGAAGLPVVHFDALDDGPTEGGTGPEPTTLLPSAAGTAPIAVAGVRPAQVRRPRAGLAGRRGRRIAGAVALPLVGVAGWLWLTSSQDHDRGTAAAAATAAPTCTVTYQLGTDDGAAFTGTLTLDTRQPRPPGGWTVSFDLPGQQAFDATRPGLSTQDGAHVVVRLTDPGAVGATGPLTVGFTGRYRGSNPLPDSFVAGGRTCQARLLGPGGVPVPATSAPAPTGTGDHWAPGDPGAAAAAPAGRPSGDPLPAGPALTATPPGPTPGPQPSATPPAQPTPPDHRGKPTGKPTRSKG